MSANSALAVHALQWLARRSSEWRTDELATVLDTRADRLREVLARLEMAGWIVSPAPDKVRYSHPMPPPHLQEVVDAIEGSASLDDCLLHPGTRCAGLRGGIVCEGHAIWTQQLTTSVLDLAPVVAAWLDQHTNRVVEQMRHAIDERWVAPVHPEPGEGTSLTAWPDLETQAPAPNAAEIDK